MDFSIMHSTQVGLVLNLLTGLISSRYIVLFDDMFSTMVSSTAANTETWIKLANQGNQGSK